MRPKLSPKGQSVADCVAPFRGPRSFSSTFSDCSYHATTETVYRHQIRPVVLDSAEAMERLLPVERRPSFERSLSPTVR